jgi:hypothetical protein
VRPAIEGIMTATTQQSIILTGIARTQQYVIVSDRTGVLISTPGVTMNAAPGETSLVEVREQTAHTLRFP